MGIFNEFHKKEKPVFTGSRFGFSASSGPGVPPPQPIVATGGATNTDGGYKYHVYTIDTPSPERNLTVTFAPSDATIELMVVGGGGGSAWKNGGGGGAGGIAYAPALPVTAGPTSYPVSVGAGGQGTTTYEYGPDQMRGTNSTFTHPVGTITGLGGAGPRAIDSLREIMGMPANTGPGGSSAGARRSGSRSPYYAAVETAAQPSQPNFGAGVLHYGNNGGDVSSSSDEYTGGGGGGAGGAGTPKTDSSPGAGGVGQAFPGFPAPAVAPGIPSPNQPAFTPAVGPTGLYGGGGGGSSENQNAGTSTGGTGGGGGYGQAGKYGTGGGGGSHNTSGYNGGPGLVVLRYPV